MLIDSQTTVLLEGLRKLQQMVANGKGCSSADKLRSREILEECEEALGVVTGTRLTGASERRKVADNGMTIQEITNKATTIAADTTNIFRLFKSMPATRGKNICTITNRTDNRLAQNKFTGQKGHIRCEVSNETELFYLIQYEDGTYNFSAEINTELL
jgi:choline kinase